MSEAGTAVQVDMTRLDATDIPLVLLDALRLGGRVTVVSSDVLAFPIIESFIRSHPGGGIIICSASLPAWLPQAIVAGLPASRVLLVGVRGMGQEEWEQIKVLGIRVHSMHHMSLNGFSEVVLGSMELARSFGPLHLYIDLDVLDPVFTGMNGSVGGLSSREFIYMMSRFSLLRNVKLCHVVSGSLNRGTSELILRTIAELACSP